MKFKEKALEAIENLRTKPVGAVGYAMDSAVVACMDAIREIPEDEINGETSDGYHTFNELYHHRAVLFSVICNLHPLCSWKAKKHHDGTMYDGMFIVGINTPEGQATYHYDIDPYWDMFKIPEAEFAPVWDGHTPDEAIRRIGVLGGDGYINIDEEMKAEAARKQVPVKPLPEERYFGIGRCPRCHAVFLDRSTGYCGNCGQALDWGEVEEAE